jgi:hypothetical protein
MPTRRQFDMTILTVTLMFVGFQVAKAAGNRWALNHPAGSLSKAAGVAVSQ